MSSLPVDELVKIGPGLGRRSKIWSVVKKRIQAKSKNGLQMNEKELQLLDTLAEDAVWINMVPLEFQTLYGTMYDEQHLRPPLSNRTRDQIMRDVPRTYTLYIEHQRYLRLEFPTDMSAYFRALQHVLEVACHQDYGCGYCQGMNFLAATFLLSEANQRSAFILFSYIVKQCHLEILYNPKCSSLLEYMHFYERRLQAHNPAVHDHLLQEEFPPLCYTVEWFTTCFLVSSPGELSACVIDLMLCGFNDIMIRVGLALMDHLQTVILQSNAEKLQLNFKKMLVLANCVEVMTRALMIPSDDINGVSRLETMKLNTDSMDPDAEWVNTMRSPTFRLDPGEPIPDDLDGLFEDMRAAELGQNRPVSLPVSSSGKSSSGSNGSRPVSLPQAPVPARDGSPRRRAQTDRPASAPIPLSDDDDPVQLPRSAYRSQDYGTGRASISSLSSLRGSLIAGVHPMPADHSSGAHYDPPTPRACSPSERSCLTPGSQSMSESSNGHHCLTAAGALDGHLVEDYVCMHMKDAETSFTDSPAVTQTSAHGSGTLRSALSPRKGSSSSSKQASSDKKKKKTQFRSSEEAATKEIMALFS